MSSTMRELFHKKQIRSVQELYTEIGKITNEDRNDKRFQKNVRGAIDNLHKQHEIRNIKCGVWELV